MKKVLVTLAVVLSAIIQAHAAHYVRIDTGTSSLLLDATAGGPLYNLYFGARIQDNDDVLNLLRYNNSAYPAFGQGTISDYALAVTHSDGNMTLDLVVEGVSESSAAGVRETRIRMKDRVYPFRVDVCYRTYGDSDVIESWTEFENGEKGPVRLRRFDSFHLPVRMGNVWFTSMYGKWANEARLVQQPVPMGCYSIENNDGIRTAHTSRAEMMLSLDGEPREDEGRVIGLALCYSGNYQLRIVSNQDNLHKGVSFHHFYAGISPDNSEYPLSRNERFVTPVVAFTYSGQGLGGVSRSFHDWARSHHLIHPDKPRDVLLNSWEGIHMDIDEAKLSDMMKSISEIGGELFVLDDGWFGRGEFRRTDDKKGLGDWTADPEKLPNGISGLISEAGRNGIRFGIWIEPEMANTASELYLAHPDWIINAPGRDVICGRGHTQIVLDLGNPEVQNHVFGVVDRLMRENPGIAYMKWDCNMSIRSFGSSYLKPSEQSKLVINYHRGLESVLRRVRDKYPDLVIQCCASGGARYNFSMTPFFDEFWVSDNTDALQRIYMQWGCSYFFPSIVMASHISASPGLQSGRIIPLKFRVDVAMSGRLGLELQPSRMTAEELDFCRRAVSDYKSVRNVVQFGDLYRLVSPYEDKDAASLMYVSKEKDDAVFFVWKTGHMCYQTLPRIRLKGLDPEKRYRVTELAAERENRFVYEGKSFSGRFLMESGLETLKFDIISNSKDNAGGFSSCVLRLNAVE